jgi:hypothetical protein
MLDVNKAKTQIYLLNMEKKTLINLHDFSIMCDYVPHDNKGDVYTSLNIPVEVVNLLRANVLIHILLH